MGVMRKSDPLTWQDVDGIILNEVPPAPNVAGVAANIGILVGQSQRGLAALTELTSLNMAQETFGKDKTSGLYKVLKNKTFGRLKFIRVVASDAVMATKNFASSATDRIQFDAKGGKGAFGNNIQVKIEEASQSRQEKHTVLCVADVASSLDGKYFVLRDEVGTVGVWIDVGDGGGAAPAGALACDRQIEVSTISADDAASVVATKIAAALEADSKFTASADGATVTVTTVAYQVGIGTVGAGDSGFTVTRTVLGAYEGKKYTIQDTNTDAVLGSETYDNVKIAAITASTFAKSKLVNVTVLSTAAEPSNVAFTSLAGGANGTVADSDYEAAIALAEQEGAGNVLFLDSYNTVRNGYLKIHAAQTSNKMVIVEGGSGDTDADAIVNVDNYRDTDGRIIYAFNPVITVIDGLEVEQPAAWWIASLFTQVAPHIDLAYGPNAQYLAGITKLKYNLSLTSYTLLNKAGICSLEFDPDMGHKVKSAVVTQVLNSEKTTILRRRMTDFLQDSLAGYLKNFGNAVNNKANRGLVKAGITRWDDQLIASGVLPGDSEMLDGGKSRLIDTESLNDDDSIGQGLFKILYKRRIFSSMRYIVLSTEIGTGVVVEEVA